MAWEDLRVLHSGSHSHPDRAQLSAAQKLPSCGLLPCPPKSGLTVHTSATVRWPLPGRLLSLSAPQGPSGCPLLLILSLQTPTAGCSPLALAITWSTFLIFVQLLGRV